jgi:cytoskeletal protein CcmA (bactofilin family)
MNETNSVLRLGTPGSTTRYIFAGNTWRKGKVQVLGPVEIFILDGFDNKGVIFGDSNNIVAASTATLRINVMTNSVDITGGGAVYASLWAASSAVTVGNDSFFYGSIYASTLTVAPNGTVDVE